MVVARGQTRIWRDKTSQRLGTGAVKARGNEGEPQMGEAALLSAR